MSGEERKPILHDSVGIPIRSGSSKTDNQLVIQPIDQQQLVIQPIEFDHKHKNLYGYLALAAFVLVLINYLMIKERTCQMSLVNGYQNFDLVQSFHMTALVVAIMVFVLSYFNFAVAIYDFKLLFYASALSIFICAALLIYAAVAITTAPCVTLGGLFQTVGIGSIVDGSTNIFSAHDGIGITVFIFDLLAAAILFFAGRRFYQRR